MSPAIDTTLALSSFPKPGDVLKGVNEVYSLGGKGLNSARWLAKRGYKVRVTGLLGESNASQFEEFFKGRGMVDLFTRVNGYSRINVMFTSSEGMFKINRPAFPNLQESEWCFEDILDVCQKDTDVCVLAGSLPNKVPTDFYFRLIDALNKKGIRTVLDTSGEALRLGVEAKPTIIKPNRDECIELIGYDLNSTKNIIKALEFLGNYADCVILSDGAQGCWFFDTKKSGDIFHVKTPEVNVFDTTSAGDTLLAEFCCNYFPQMTLTEKAMRYGVAAGAAATTVPGAMSPDSSLIECLINNTIITKF